MPRSWVLVLIGLSVFFLTAVVFLLVKTSSATSISQSPFACNEISIAGTSSEKTNILFVGSQADSQEYTDYLLSQEPFAASREQFNIYRIDKLQSCSSYKGIALYCYSRELLGQASVCPHDYIIVLEDAPSTIRASAYMGVASINTRLPKTVLLHEVGHLFGLDEEYDAGYNPGSDSPNCKTRCEQFEGALCYQECSDSSHLRSVDEGVMRTLSPTDTSDPYGSHNRAYIFEKITKPKTSLTGFATKESSECSEESHLLIEVSPSDSDWEAHVVAIEPGCAPRTEGTFNYILQDDSGLVVSSGNFAAPQLFTDGNEDADDVIEGETFENETPFYISAPVDEDAVSFTIIDGDGNEIAQGSTQLNDRLCLIP